MTTKHTLTTPGYFSEIDSDIKAYFVGFIAGDGALVYNRDRRGRTYQLPYLTISLHSRDRVILDRLKHELGYSGPIYELKTHSQVRLVITNPLIIRGLMSQGIEPRKSLSMTGSILLNIPERYRKSFILGYFDADGSVTVRKLPYTTKSGKTTYHIKQSVQIRGTRSFLEAIADELTLDTYCITFSGGIHNLAISSLSGFTKFYNSVYADCDFFLDRKHYKFETVILQDQTISSPQIEG